MRTSVFGYARTASIQFRTGSFALFLLEPVQESRVDGFGPVEAEVGRDRIKAAEQMSAEENLHGDRVRNAVI